MQQWHYLLVYAEEDEVLGTKLRKLLQEGQKHMTIGGPWEVQAGSYRLDIWQKLFESSTVVLVLLSNHLLRDEILDICFPKTLTRDRGVVPLFVEPLKEDEITPNLRPIVQRLGENIYQDNWDAKKYIKTLKTAYNYNAHYKREVYLLDKLLKEVKEDANYVCKCKNC